MARARIKRRHSDDLKEATKETLVISYLLDNGNIPSSASTIWNAWNPKNPDAVGTVESRGGRTLSLTGTIKVCDRLVREGILVAVKEYGYNNRSIVFYRLPIKGDRSYENGFLRVVERTKNMPFLLMNSNYCRSGIENFLLTKIETDLRITLTEWRRPIAWTIGRSPTALMLVCDRNLTSGDIERIENKDERLRRFLAAIHGSIEVDRVSGYRGRLFTRDESLANKIMMLLAAGTQKAGSKDKNLAGHLEKINEEIR